METHGRTKRRIGYSGNRGYRKVVDGVRIAAASLLWPKVIGIRDDLQSQATDAQQ